MICPQCNKSPNGASTRLVKDSCGHSKCRVCLLEDENGCLQCKNQKILAETGVIRVPNNHTPVITCSKSVNKIVEQKINMVVKKEPPEKINLENHDKVIVKSQVKIPNGDGLIPKHVVIVPTEPVQYKCNICNKQFKTKYNAKYHLYCGGLKKPLQCSVCAKDFITKAQLDLHLFKHCKITPYKCNTCERYFSDNTKLKRHLLLHTSEKPFVCADCGKAFRSKESLKIHLLIHRGEKPFNCKICNMGFNNSSNLKKHLISHSKEKIHMCEECGKRFKMKWALTVHRRSHQRLRPFTCPTCSRSFVNNKDLQRHQLVHLDTKAFTCSICLTSFRRKDNLYRHVKNTHPGKIAEPITSTVKQLISNKPTKPVVDNPNAINVITKTNIEKPPQPPEPKPDIRPINGPIKLAFKTSAFKNNYNINRTYDDELFKRNYDMAESVNICQKILSPHSPPSREVVQKAPELASIDASQQILGSFNNRPLHYVTSFQHHTQAIIKNIKFKLPSNYLLKPSDTFKHITPLQPVTNVNLNLEQEFSNENTYTELKPISFATTSVIVNNIADNIIKKDKKPTMVNDISTTSNKTVKGKKKVRKAKGKSAVNSIQTEANTVHWKKPSYYRTKR